MTGKQRLFFGFFGSSSVPVRALSALHAQEKLRLAGFGVADRVEVQDDERPSMEQSFLRDPSRAFRVDDGALTRRSKARFALTILDLDDFFDAYVTADTDD